MYDDLFAQVQLNVACKFVKDMLKGDEVTELRMELKGVLGHEMGEDYKEEWAICRVAITTTTTTTIYIDWLSSRKALAFV